jgi:hypothetical protein
LVASLIGYKKWTAEIETGIDTAIHITMKESVNALDAVTITVGTFAASDKKRASILEPLDIYTTASANGDAMAAIRTMPGAQASPDDGRLLVRGGDAYESKTYIDGMLAASPYYSKTPDAPTRGRFSPSVFSGVQFNTGGYSAEYGQALSSVLELNSRGVASENNTGLSIMSMGVESNISRAFLKSSLWASAGYFNMGLYQKMPQTHLQWVEPVESFNFNTAYCVQPKPGELLKVFLNADYGNLSYETTEEGNQHLKLSKTDGNIYSKATYNGVFSDKWCYRAGVAVNYSNGAIQINNTAIGTQKLNADSRFTATWFVSEHVVVKGGVNNTYTHFSQDITECKNPVFQPGYHSNTSAAFIEPEIKFNKYLAVRPGIRAEYNSLINQAIVDPRLAMAVKTGKKSQMSAAWGRYHQVPREDYLKYKTDLKMEEAVHYIAGFQTGDVSGRLLRTEIYYKKYNKLITWDGSVYRPENIANTGLGYAGGLDLFWSDKKSIRNFDYRLTYSYTDSKRLYNNLPQQTLPDYISKHNFSLVSKYWIHAITTQVGASFTLASPRTFDHPATPGIIDYTTNWYNNLSLNLSHVFYLGNQYSVFYVALTNVLGSDNILGYRASVLYAEKGGYSLTPVRNDLKRSLFVALLLSF